MIPRKKNSNYIHTHPSFYNRFLCPEDSNGYKIRLWWLHNSFLYLLSLLPGDGTERFVLDMAEAQQHSEVSLVGVLLVSQAELLAFPEYRQLRKRSFIFIPHNNATITIAR